MEKQTLRMNERGGSSVGVIIGLIVLVVVGFVCVQLIPIYYDQWTFEDEFNNEKLNLIFVNVNDDAKVKDAVVQKVKTLIGAMKNAKVSDKDIKVTVDPANKKIIVDVRYLRPHKVPFLQNPLMFHVKKENRPI